MSDTQPMTAEELATHIAWTDKQTDKDRYTQYLTTCLHGLINQATNAQAEQIAALTADNARLREALKRTSNNEDCPKCDSGRLRPTASGHWDTCSFAQARDLLSTPPADPSGLLRLVRAAVAWSKNIQKRWELPGGKAKGVVYYQEEYGASVEFDLHKVIESLDPALRAAAERSGK